MAQAYPFRVKASKPSVRQLHKAHILYAIESGGEDNLILQELANLVKAYLEDCNRLRGGGLNALLHTIPTCAIEEIALNMAIAAEQAKRNKAQNEVICGMAEGLSP